MSTLTKCDNCGAIWSEDGREKWLCVYGDGTDLDFCDLACLLKWAHKKSMVDTKTTSSASYKFEGIAWVSGSRT
jgi:hypothetical protein